MRNAICVGASLLANTSGQAALSSMTQRFREQARSHRGGHWLEIRARHPTVGFHTIGKVFVYSEKVGAKASQP
ncbi:hypothetical protein ACPCHW_03150 [Pseudomonas siliginis]|uniref:hypothetical protein n=1 Tax=Pseudomonas siliginis TaxID=2842346 RepID=UPI003C2C2AF7